MELTREIATKIVSEVNNLLPQKINLMDDRGFIIASTDEKRVDTFHGGAWRIISEQLPQVVVSEDGEYTGALRGLNYPIVMDGKIRGVLGITGDSAEVVRNARIIQRMTELLLSEASLAEQRIVGENVRNSYLDQWLSGDRKLLNAAFLDRGLELQMDLSIPRRVLACCVYSPGRKQGWETMRGIDAAKQLIKQSILSAGRNNLFFQEASGLTCLVTLQTDGELLRLARDLCAQVEAAFPELAIAVGIDDQPGDFLTMHANYVRAQRALAACMRTHRWKIRFYGDLNMEVFSDQVDSATKQEYIRKIMKGFSDGEIVRLLPMLEVFYDNDGSLTAAARELFIHKNTLQYKLRRIAERTGYDPRSIRHSSLFYNAIYFYPEVKDAFQV